MFRKAVALMKMASTSKMPIKVRRVAMNGLDGSCEKRDSYFLVKINKNLLENHSIDVLIHEVAHADAWDDYQKEVHGPRWGMCYSRLYRIWEKFLEEHN